MVRVSKVMFGLAAAALLAACAQREPEPVYVDPAPVTAEPSYSKY